jgi:hypothetical protein
VLTGGLLSRVVRVETASHVYALKQYPERVLGNSSLSLVCEGQVLACSEGLPVSEVLRHRHLKGSFTRENVARYHS